MQTQFGGKIKAIRSDRGGEYISKNVQELLKQHGIIHQKTTPYTPQQNGVAEPKNRSSMEMARCMLYDADMHIDFGEKLFQQQITYKTDY